MLVSLMNPLDLSILHITVYFISGDSGKQYIYYGKYKKKSQKWAISRKMTRQKRRHVYVEDEEIGKGNQIFDI